MTEADRDLLWNPNKNARPVELKRLGALCLVDGYQRYITTSWLKPLVPLRRNLLAKSRVLMPALRELRRSAHVRSLSDLGCNTGYFVTAAVSLGFDNVYAYDLDPDVASVFSDPIMKDVQFSNRRVQDVTQVADVTVAISLFHWLVGQAEKEDDAVGEVLRHFARISKHTAFVELVNSDDPLVKRYKHYSQEVTPESFEVEAKKYFASAKLIGESSPTRQIYALRAKH